MPLTDETLAAAREWKPAALQMLLAQGYAPARRIGHALSGHEAIGRAVADVLVRRSLRLLPKWRDPSSPENWFYHHAVLTTRAVNAPPPDPHEDPLVRHGAAEDAAYVAFVRAMRHLPVQQREAFILHHGERLNPRMLAVAMDCSTQAAGTHLQAATEALQAVSEGKAETLAGVLTRAYAELTAAQPDPTPAVRVHVRRVRRRRWLRRAVRVLIVALVLTGIGAAVWILWDVLLQMWGERM